LFELLNEPHDKLTDEGGTSVSQGWVVAKQSGAIVIVGPATV
jgi:hypothetical protein